MATCAIEPLPLGSKTLLVWLHTKQPPSDEEWEHGMAQTEAIGLQKVAYLVVTDGGGPNAAHRARFQQVVGKDLFPVAVLSDDRLARGIVTAISWFNSAIKAFRPRDLTGALAHVGVDQAHAQRILEKLQEMQGKVPRVSTLDLVLHAAGGPIAAAR